jgi:hypothetical protein
MAIPRSCAVVLLIAVLCAGRADAQFRRGLVAESTTITLYPLEPPALLLPAGDVHVQVRNASGASARILDRIQDRLTSQLTDNDTRLRVVQQDGHVILVATLTEWNESRRNSTTYVSETRQVGTREVTDKNGKKRQEPVYEYGRNRPSVVVEAAAGLRLEVRHAGGAPLADETARFTIREEYLLDAGPPSREEIEDLLIDGLVQKGAGRISPGRQPVRVLLARSDDVDRLNGLAQSRRWEEWLEALEGVRPHGNRGRDAYRLHNLAVAHEALAYEATHLEDWDTRLDRASGLIAQAMSHNPKEKYIAESAERIGKSHSAYRTLAGLYGALGLTSASSRLAGAPAPPGTSPVPAPGTGDAQGQPAGMTNQDVIDLRVAGLDDDNLVAAIADGQNPRFDLAPAALKALLEAGISNRVIAAMRSRMP